MDNQHRKIKGYRELSHEEINLINEIKNKGLELEQLVQKVEQRIELQIAKGLDQPYAEPMRWARIGKTDIQEAIDSLQRFQEMRAEDVAPNKRLDEQCTVGRDRFQP